MWPLGKVILNDQKVAAVASRSRCAQITFMRQRVCLFRFGITYRQSPPGQFYTYDVIDIHRDRILTFHRFLSFQMYHTNKRINELKWVHRFKCISCKIFANVDMCVDSIIMACGYNFENSSSKKKKKKKKKKGTLGLFICPTYACG